jgi:hypothetical protein
MCALLPVLLVVFLCQSGLLNDFNSLGDIMGLLGL